jgi:AraC-like DNA-binding protein
MTHFTADGLEFCWLSSRTQARARTSHLPYGPRDSALVSVQVEGRGQARQDGRTANLAEGGMTFLDSTRPYSLHFSGPFCQLVVQVPRSMLSTRRLSVGTAVELSSAGPARIIADFIVGLGRQLALDSPAVAALVPHAVGLLDVALALATRQQTEVSGDALTRERIHRYVRQHAQDPKQDADATAAACGMSRRTLFRALSADGESYTTLLRRARVTLVQQALLAAPDRSLTRIAADCGFGGETQMYRAFRRVTGTTPAAYRREALCPEPASGRRDTRSTPPAIAAMAACLENHTHHQ